MEILITQVVEIIKEMELNSFGFSFIVLSIFIFLNLNNIVGFLKSCFSIKDPVNLTQYCIEDSSPDAEILREINAALAFKKMTGITAGKMKREILLQIYNRDTLNITWPLIKSALPYIFFKKKELSCNR